MVAIFTGVGAGYTRGSGNLLGGGGLIGSGSLGRGGDSVSVNAATGNLLISQQDEFLIGKGLDISIGRTYNSLGQAHDGDNGDNWQQSTTRRVFGLTGTQNTAGSTIKRQGADGAVITYTWNATRSAYVTTDGDGAHDELKKVGATWVWTEGSTRFTDTYSAAGTDNWRITSATEKEYFGLTYSYVDDKLDKVTTADGDWTQYIWSTTGNKILSILTGYTDRTTPTPVARTLTRTHYTYDGSNRLEKVKVDLSPGDSLITDGATYVTTYAYVLNSNRISSITQTDGSGLTIEYDASGRVTRLRETVASGVERETNLAYGASSTTITGPDGQVTELKYDGGNRIDTAAANWGGAGVTKEAASAINGEAATRLTSSVGASASHVAPTVGNVAAGTTVKFAVTLQAVTGSATQQSVSLLGGTSGNGTDVVTARIISGPGTLSTTANGLWHISGLSTTEATRIEITRTFAQAEEVKANVHVDYVGGARDGQQLIMSDASVTLGAEYARTQRLTQITAPPVGGVSQTVKFTYDASGNVASVEDPAGKLTTYTYDASGNVLTATDANLNVVTRTYSAKNELLTETRTGSDKTGETVNHTTRYVYNSLSQLRYIVSAEGHVTEYEWSGANQYWTTEYPQQTYNVTALADNVAITEAQMTTWRTTFNNTRDKIVVDQFDARGNLTKRTRYGSGIATWGNGSFAEGYSETSYVYDQAGRLLSTYDNGVLAQTYVYDGMGRVVASSNPASGVTTYRFDDANTTTLIHYSSGLTQTQVYNKAGDLLSDTTSTPGYQPAELLSDLTDWGTTRVTRTSATAIDGKPTYTYTLDATGNVGVIAKGMSVAAGETVTWRIAVKGNPSDQHRIGINGSVTGWGTLAGTDASAVIISGPGSITKAGGQPSLLTLTGLSETQETIIELRRTFTQAEGVYAYFYVGVGTSVPAGTAVTLGATNLVRTITDGEEAIASTTAFRYDALGRVRMITAPLGVNSTGDATDYNSFILYDNAGRKTADIAADGGVTEYRYDAAGRLAATIARATKLTPTQMANLATAGGDVLLGASSIGTGWPAASTSDVWNWNIYDDGGRLIQSIDGNGGVVDYVYDNSNRLIRTVGYAATVSVGGFKTTLPTARQTVTAGEDDRVSRNFYDRDGRLVGTLDIDTYLTGPGTYRYEGYLSEIKYDHAGQKVSEIAYSTELTGALKTLSFDQLLASANTTATTNRRTHHVYDGQGLLRYQVDSLGYVTSFTYDLAQQLTSTISHKTAITIAPDDVNYATVKAAVALIVNDATDRASYSVYNNRGQVAYAIDAGGLVSAFTYDVSGRVIKVVQFATLRATSTLPTLATMASWAAGQASNTSNRISRTYYSADGLARFTVDAEGYRTENIFDANRNLVSVTRSANPVTVTDSTTIDQLDAMAAGAGITTLSAYDQTGRLHTVTDAENGITRYDYNALGLVEKVTDPLSRASYNYYDAAGRLVKTRDAGDYVTEIGYNAFGEVKFTKGYYNKGTGPVTAPPSVAADNSKDIVAFNIYDDLGRLTYTVDGESYVTRSFYNRFGEVEKVVRYATTFATTAATTLTNLNDHFGEEAAPIPGSAAVTSFTYDNGGRVLTSKDAMAYEEKYQYDGFGNRISVENKLGGVTIYAYDKRGLLISETLPISSYNANGSVQDVIVNSYAYDALGNRTQMIEGVGLNEARTTTYEYDRLGRLKKTIGQARTVLDQSDHVTETTGFTPTQTYVYDAVGNVTSVTNAANQRTVYFYDDLGRKVAEIVQVERTGSPLQDRGTYTRYVYDANGNITSTRVYDPLVIVPDNGGPDTATTAPSSAYRETLFEYDSLNRLTKSSVVAGSGLPFKSGSYNVVWSGNTTAIDLLYEYDAFGNVVKTIDGNGRATWNFYDELGRKTQQVDALNYLTAWTYDAEGNVLTEKRYSVPGATPNNSRTPPAAPGADTAMRETVFTYDENGNRLSETRKSVTIFKDGTTPTTEDVDVTIRWEYNGLGQVTQRNEATDDYTKLKGEVGDESTYYSYDVGGRLTREERAAFTSHQSTVVTPTVDYSYNALGDLVRTVAAGAGDAQQRVTTYSYGAGGLLASMTDAENYVHTYSYDRNGTLIRDEYSRSDSQDQYRLNAVLTKVDALGRTIEQSVAAWTGTAWAKGDIAATEYNAFGEVKRSGINGLWQTVNEYDAAGRLWRTNAGDGVWKIFGHDKNGNQTVAITLGGTGENFATFSLDDALNKVLQENVNATYTVYDARNMATSVVEEGRRVKAGTDPDAVKTITTSRAYNAFGETLTETNALGGVTTYGYNRAGRMVRSEGPAVAMTLENGKEIWVKPSQDFHYDKAGRLVAQHDANGSYAETGTDAGNATSKTANTGNLTRLTLLAGTGYNGTQALVTTERQADDGVKQTKYDIHGDARTLIAPAPELRTTEQVFDRLGRLVQVTHPGATGQRLIDSYSYDILGQRLKHWNNFLETSPSVPDVETTDYDIQGRVIATRSFGGDVSSTTYAWDASIAAIAGTVTGGWTETVRLSDSAANLAASIYKQSSDKSDIFGRVVQKTDMGSHVTNYAYDAAGRQISATLVASPSNIVTSFTYYNTGQLATNSGLAGTATYGYDVAGNRASETLVNGSGTVKAMAANYDAMGRMIAWSATGTTTTPAASTTTRYDANGNIRATLSLYREIDAYGTAATTDTSKNYWFLYDTMNRVVRDRGTLSGTAGAVGTTIVRGTDGTDYLYNDSGDRVSSISTRPVWETVWHSHPQPGEPDAGFYTWEQVDGVSQETFTYDASGRLYQVHEAGVIRSDFAYDKMGRVTLQQDFGGIERGPGGLSYSRAVTYNAKGQVASDNVMTRRDRNEVYTPGATVVSDEWRNITTYGYGSGSSYALGSVLTATVQAYRNGFDTGASGAPDTSTTTSYEWWDGAVQTYITHDSDTGSGSNPIYNTDLQLNGLGQLVAAEVDDGVARDVTYKLDENGQIIRRDETRESTPSQASPHEIFYRFAGKQMGMIGNNGTSDTGYSESVVERSAYDEPPTSSNAGLFRNGKKTGASFYADFAQSLTPANSNAQGSSGGTYTVRAGDTLATIAQMLYGDANLWYKIAEANGLSSGSALVEGMALTLPAGVTKNTHNAETFKPYDPMDAIGDLSPTTPKPPKKPKCALLKQILVAVVAIAVVAITQQYQVFAALGPVLSGAAGAALGSVVSQGAGIALGVQDGFSWKSVGLAAIGGAISGGITGLGEAAQATADAGRALSGIDKFAMALNGNGIGMAVLRGAGSNALTQGIGRITGLQSKFDFAGVAAAGAVSGFGQFVGNNISGAAEYHTSGKMAGFLKTPASTGNAIASSAAGALAGAATRSAITGENFGDNILRVLPDAIGNALVMAGRSVLARQLEDPVSGGGGGEPIVAGGGLRGNSTMRFGANDHFYGQDGGLAMSGYGDFDADNPIDVFANKVVRTMLGHAGSVLDMFGFKNNLWIFRWPETTLGLRLTNPQPLPSQQFRQVVRAPSSPRPGLISRYKSWINNITPSLPTDLIAAHLPGSLISQEMREGAPPIAQSMAQQRIVRQTESGGVGLLAFGQIEANGAAVGGAALGPLAMLLPDKWTSKPHIAGGLAIGGTLSPWNLVGAGEAAVAQRATGAFNPAIVAGGKGLGIFAERELTISPKGLDLVRTHLSNPLFEADPRNVAMLQRLETAMQSGQKVSGADAIFYTHEAAEATKMARLGGYTQPNYDLAHAATLDKYNVSPYSVYHPDVIRANPALSNKNWYAFWGISK
ncbi:MULTISPECIES: DUF6531 domain-containing protein [unclassified Sphingopyxis]|uniref:DUF6531 domain-containing protein n=1 Tax=unclassified Sphingopyxis TaxID=2614943 RepID=UPI000736349C|nr:MULTISPECIES: DUF6531 domain-containing protein [unclassified Sphingopyxis]KTE42969.1 hypothetical protein ATE62_04445 [Sphingopyxis sp. HIX]KTE85205.1 hypothetical protein ATE72_04920 [Sphingopyxis sp. HXXIV]